MRTLVNNARTDPRVALNASDERIENADVIVFFHDDKLDENAEQAGVSGGANEEVEVGGGGNHLLHRALK